MAGNERPLDDAKEMSAQGRSSSSGIVAKRACPRQFACSMGAESEIGKRWKVWKGNCTELILVELPMAQLGRPILRDTQRAQPILLAALHPPVAQRCNRPDRTPGPKNCAFPCQVKIFAGFTKIHVSALLLSRAISLQAPLQFD